MREEVWDAGWGWAAGVWGRTCSYAGCASNVPAGMPTTRGASSSEIVYAAPTASSIAVTSMSHVLGWSSSAAAMAAVRCAWRRSTGEGEGGGADWGQ